MSIQRKVIGYGAALLVLAAAAVGLPRYSQAGGAVIPPTFASLEINFNNVTPPNGSTWARCTVYIDGVPTTKTGYAQWITEMVACYTQGKFTFTKDTPVGTHNVYARVTLDTPTGVFEAYTPAVSVMVSREPAVTQITSIVGPWRLTAAPANPAPSGLGACAPSPTAYRPPPRSPTK